MSLRSKRTPLPTNKILENEIQKSECVLRELLETDIDTESTPLSHIESYFKDLKLVFKQYHSNVSALVLALIECGSTAAAKSLRSDRNILRNEVNEIIALMNRNDDMQLSELAATVSVYDSQQSNISDDDVPNLGDVPVDNHMARVATSVQKNIHLTMFLKMM